MKLSIVTEPKKGGNLKLNLKTQYSGPTAADTKLYTPRTHVYMKPEMWIGANADIFIEEEIWLYNFEESKIYNNIIKYVPGIERIFMEILANAADNANMSRRKGADAGKIVIVMNNSHISITNYGFPMPVEVHPEETTKYVPEVSFGRLLTSRHYENERNESGTNGVGSKATNIFSKEFCCVVIDSVRHKKYTQVWNDNMKVCHPPLIEEYNGKISSVQIIYKMDFTRFGYPEPNGDQGGYPTEIFHLFARHALDTSFNAKIPVIFNEKEFNVSNMKDYGRLYFGDLVDSAVVHYQWPAGTEVIKKKKGYQVAKNPGILPEVELLALDTPDNSCNVSFANCLMTKNGGIHVNSAIKAVADSTVKMVNEKMFAKKTKGKKEVDAKERRAYTININDVKPHISILISVKVKDPKFDGQEKTKLMDSKPPPKIAVSEESLKIVNKWQLINRLYAAIEAKQWNTMSKKNGKLQARVRTKKGIDANLAGKPRRKETLLFVSEGDSGASYFEHLFALLPGGLDLHGCLPMKGKNLNVMNASIFDIDGNKEFNQLKKLLGLSEGVDYMDDKNYDTLRYGGLVIGADADVDGKHIAGLLICYFHCRFPALLARGFVKMFITPIISVVTNKTINRFYREVDYEEWMKNTPGSEKLGKDHHNYYKGLAGSNKDDIKVEALDPKITLCFYDVDAPESLSKAFHEERADDRKEWMVKGIPQTDDYNYEMMPISWFINHELILHSLDNVNRTIPKLMDGLKEGQRKIIYAMHINWPIGSNKKKYGKEKVAQFAGTVAKKTAYKHGEKNLEKTIVGMAQDFIGSNNIAYLAQEGLFGTRSMGGKNAGESRYTHTLPMPMVAHIYNKKDAKILTYKEDEKESIEPEQYLPIVPMILINGANGIGTGWSSYVPPHNPLDVIKYLRLLLTGTPVHELPKLIPWFRNYLGTIEIINRKTKTKTIIDNSNVNNVEINQDEEDNEDNQLIDEEFAHEEKHGCEDIKKQLYSMKLKGNFEVKHNGDIIVRELPIGRTQMSYLKWLEKLVDEKKIKDFRNLSGLDIVYFEIYGYKGDSPTHQNLYLEKSKGLSNMVLLDENDKPVKYEDANHILVKFYELRLPFYQKRKNYMIKKIDDDIINLTHKAIFYRAIIDGKLMVINTKVADIHAGMDLLGVPHEIYTKSGLRNVSEDGVIELYNDIATKTKEKEELEKISIEKMMLTDLDEFEKAYRREYKIKEGVIRLNIKKTTINNTNNKVDIVVPKCPSSGGKHGKLIIQPRNPKLNVK